MSQRPEPERRAHRRGRGSGRAPDTASRPAIKDDAEALESILASRVRLLAPLSPLIVAFAGLDWILYPALAPRWLAYRVATVALLLLVVQPSARRIFRGAPFPELIAFATVTSLCFAAMTFESGGFRSEHYVIFVLLCWAFSVIALLPARRAVVLAAAILGPYVLSGMLRGDVDSTLMVFRALLLTGTLLFTALGSHLASTLFLDAQRAERKARRLIRMLEESARRDPLTGIWNRRALEERIEAELGRLGRGGAGFCLMIADLDLFKSVNDRFGHPTGDLVLVRFCRTVESILRAHDGLFRLGGEEFAILLRDADVADASVAAERVRSSIEAMRIDVEKERLGITASLGVVEAQAGDRIGLLLERADRALYRAKAAGRNRVVCQESRAHRPVEPMRRAGAGGGD